MSGIEQSAIGLIYQAFGRQAAILAYMDVFAMCGIAAFCAAPLALLLTSSRALLLTSSRGGGSGALPVVMNPAIGPVEAKASRHLHHMHMKTHGWQRTYAYPGGWIGPRAQPMAGAYGQSDWVCPGIGRSFDCKIWPPPFEDDPDRKVSKY